MNATLDTSIEGVCASQVAPIRASTTPLTSTLDTAMEAWASAEAAYRAAESAARRAFRARLDAAHAVSETLPPHDRSNWPAISKDPRVAPLVAAEEQALSAEKRATAALIMAPAPDWRAWALKFQIVREQQDDLLNPLDPRDRKAGRQKGEFPGTRLAADILAYALGAHTGLIKPEFIELIPGLVAKLARKVTDIDVTNETLAQVAAASGASASEGFAELYNDASRLVKDGPAEPPSGAPRPLQGSLELQSLLDASDRVSCAAACLPDRTHRADIDRLDAEADALHRRFLDAPVDSPEAAVTKLQWTKKAFEDGATGHEERVIDQVIGFLIGGGDDSDLLKLGERFEAAWAAERAVPSDASDSVVDAVTDATGKLAAQIVSTKPQTMAGLRLKARAVQWCQGLQPHDAVQLISLDHPVSDLGVAQTIVNDLFPGDDFTIPGLDESDPANGFVRPEAQQVQA